jgi:hypothetical protein
MSETESSQFVEPVEGIGTFTFARRNMRLEIKSAVERKRLSEGEELDGFTALFVEAVADLKVLIVEGPDGWSPSQIDDMNPFDDATYGRVLKVWSALRGKEETFRGSGKAVSSDR